MLVIRGLGQGAFSALKGHVRSLGASARLLKSYTAQDTEPHVCQIM